MERSQQEPWVQVVGRIAVCRPGREPTVLSGTTRVLLAMLVAAGDAGAELEQVARAFWPDERPSSWDVALRVASSNLKSQLPEDWDIVNQAGSLRLVPGNGFVDTWRIESELSADVAPGNRPGWIDRGAPFDGISGIPLIDEAVERVQQILSRVGGSSRAQIDPFAAEMPLNERQRASLAEWIQETRRSIVTAAAPRQAAVASAALEDGTTQTSVVVGDRGLLLPLGPFSIAFPELRNEIDLRQGRVESTAPERAFRVVAEAISQRAADAPQRLLIENAHELDTASLKVASLFIDRAPQSDCSIIICADSSHRDIRWLDFLRRSLTAGCELVEADTR